MMFRNQSKSPTLVLLLLKVCFGLCCFASVYVFLCFSGAFGMTKEYSVNPR